MGMDLQICFARNHEVFKHEWWNNKDVKEEFYGRRAWHYVENCHFIPKEYEPGDFIQMRYENIEEMIKVACENRNYWGTYDDVPALCELRDRWESLEERGFKLYFEYDY